MTGEELERAIGFLLESQAALTSKVDANTEAIARNSDAIARLTATAERHELELVEMRSDMREMQSEVREAVGTIRGVAESMAENVKLLTAMHRETRERLDRLEGGR